MIGIGLVAKFLMPGLMFPYMVVYSYFINPGQTEAFYQQYLLDNRVAFSIWVGIPFFLLLSWIVGHRVKSKIVLTNVLIWTIYVALDVPLEIFFTGELLGLGGTTISGTPDQAWLCLPGKRAGVADGE